MGSRCHRGGGGGGHGKNRRSEKQSHQTGMESRFLYYMIKYSQRGNHAWAGGTQYTYGKPLGRPVNEPVGKFLSPALKAPSNLLGGKGAAAARAARPETAIKVFIVVMCVLS